MGEPSETELEVADERATSLFGKSFCAIDYAGRREIFIDDEGELILLGRGSDFDEAFEQAIPFFNRFYAKGCGGFAVTQPERRLMR